MGAGIIPISVDTDGDIKVLLGRERFVNQWRGSCRWSGFEGARKEGETMRDTALREFQEETLDVVSRIEDVTRCVTDRQYYIRIVLKISNERKPDRYHATYVLAVEWDEDVQSRFQKTREHVEYVDRLAQEWHHLRPPLLGERDVDVGPVRDMGDGSCVVWRTVTDDTRVVAQPRWTQDEGNPTLLRAHADAAECASLQAWDRVRDRLHRALREQHPCIRCRRDATWGLLQDVAVERDYLEKDQVRWWSLPQLEAVLDGRGQWGGERFRPYFLPVLQTLVDELRTKPPVVGCGCGDQGEAREADDDACRECEDDDATDDATEKPPRDAPHRGSP